MRKIRTGREHVEYDPETIKFSDLLGKTLVDVEKGYDEYGDDFVDFQVNNGPRYRLFHEDDCCESVEIEDVVGELEDLIGSPLTMAEETSSNDLGYNPDPPRSRGDESYTWTFYRLATVKGYVTIRWYGLSNGFYSESVSFGRVIDE